MSDPCITKNVFAGVRGMSVLGLLSLAVLGACSGGSSAPGGASSPPAGLRISGSRTGGASGDALAASLLISTGATVARPGRPAFRMADARLESELRFRAGDHVETGALASGVGPRLEGSARNRRLAAQIGAPPDANGNGTNLDETLTADLALLARTAGSDTIPEIHPLLFSWNDGMADLVAAPGAAGRGSFSAYRALPGPVGVVEMEQIGHAMLARLLAASPLLIQSRGNSPGATAEEGLRGLLLMQQAVAMEETLLAKLFWDGGAFVRIDPDTYDPRAGSPKWLPHRVRALDDPALPGAPGAYLPNDQATSLSGLAAVMTAASELAWLASDGNPYPSLRGVLVGSPFRQVPEVDPGRRGDGKGLRPAADAGQVNWEDDIQPLLHGRCLVCHRSPSGFNSFFVDTYETVLAGGQSGALGYPAVVKGDHTQSLLWEALVRSVPAIGVSRMPFGGPFLLPDQVSLVADWIDAGVPRNPGTGEGRLGLDLTRVLFRNLEALHMDAATGALHDRHEGDAPSGFASARSTGDALIALAAYRTAIPGDPESRDVLARAAAYAQQSLSEASGRSRALVEIATGTPQGGQADLLGHARLTAGLLAAGRALGRADFVGRGRALAQVLLGEYFDNGKDLFRTDLDRVGRRYTPVNLAAILDALREIAADGAVPGARSAHDRFLASLLPVLVFSEFDGRGEILGDGIPDTDDNGIPEPALAGGANGRAPLLVGEILEGPAPSDEPRAGPVTWSGHIQPLFRSACASCHLDGAQRGSYRLDTPTLLRQPGESQGKYPLVVPGDPEASLLYRKLTDRLPPVGEQMPLALPPLDAQGKALVFQWIAEGATSR